MEAELETHKVALNKFIAEYQSDPSEFWLHHIKTAIDNVLYLSDIDAKQRTINKSIHNTNQSLKG